LSAPNNDRSWPLGRQGSGGHRGVTDQGEWPTVSEPSPPDLRDALEDNLGMERVMRAGLEDFELSEDDRALLDVTGEGGVVPLADGPQPVVAVVGRPNVGKSTLVNRILGRREAVVEDTPGVTRDRVAYDAEWVGRRFRLVDTGGWEQDVLGIDASVAAQAEYAIETADAVVFVVDSTVG